MKNAKLGKKPPNFGKKTSEEVKLKMSLSKIGIKRKPFSKETLQKMSQARVGKIGIIPSDESRKKMSESQKFRASSNNANYKGKSWYKCKETGKRIWILN